MSYDIYGIIARSSNYTKSVCQFDRKQMSIHIKPSKLKTNKKAINLQPPSRNQQITTRFPQQFIVSALFQNTYYQENTQHEITMGNPLLSCMSVILNINS